MAHKFAKYRGQRFKVIKEEGRFVTLEGFGYHKRQLKDEVIFEDMPEEKLDLEPKDDFLGSPVDAPVQDLPKERKDVELIKDMVHDQRDPKNEPEGEVVVPVDPPANLQTPGIEKTTNYPNFPKLGIDVTSITPEDRDAENEKRRIHSVNNFKEKLFDALKVLDDTESKDPNIEPGNRTIQPLAEDGGTTSVAGAGCADGTTNPATIGLQGIARFDARLGASPTKRKNP